MKATATDYAKTIEMLKRKDFLTSTDAGVILYASCATIRNYCANGSLEHTQVPGGRRKIRHDSIKRFMVLNNVRNKDYVSDAEYESIRKSLAGDRSPKLQPSELVLEARIVLEDGKSSPQEKINRLRGLLDAARP